MTYGPLPRAIRELSLYSANFPPKEENVEHILRVISWTVVLGAVLVLAYAGFKPVLEEMGYPPVDENQVRGSMLSPDEQADVDASSAVAQVSCESSVEEECTDPKP